MRHYLGDFLLIIEGNFLRARISPDSINLIVTSPPYNLEKSYGVHDDALEYEEYLEFSEKWLKKALRLLKPDGRLCLNIPLDTNKMGLRPVYADLVGIAQDVGFKYAFSIVWNEGNISRRTAWGSWLSASAPYVISPVEMIGVFYKDSWKRLGPGESDITKAEFMDWTLGIWRFSGESAKKIGHPAPFPVELPLRCIKLFTYKGDLVLDPFLGSGSTLVACARTGRKGIGVEIDPQYVRIAKDRLLKELSENLLQG
ncbi:MAG: site-specific DNA-methyltransferase [candidate division WOR-3 bacterium]